MNITDKEIAYARAVQLWAEAKLAQVVAQARLNAALARGVQP